MNRDVYRITLPGGQIVTLNKAGLLLFAQFNWSISSSGYLGRYDCGKYVRFHQQILRHSGSYVFVVDRINRDKLDNRVENLRVTTRSVNAQNSAPRGGRKYRGIWKDKRLKGEHWYAGIKKDGKQIHLGVFETEIEAARAYDKAAREIYGDSAYRNLPDFRVPEQQHPND